MQLSGETAIRSASVRTKDLRQVIAELVILNQTTERGFLNIGARIGEFTEAANLISRRSTALANMISGVDGYSTAQSLKVAFDCFTEMRARYRNRNDGLGAMRQAARRLRQNLDGFEEIVSNLRATGILTRIEIARLGTTGPDFGSLAADMKSLTGNVQQKVEVALETGALLIQPIENAMGNIAALDEKQVRDLSAAFLNLSTFRDIQNKARDASAQLSVRCDAVSAAFRRLIVAIQIHDMTRQLVEHVIHVLWCLCDQETEGGQEVLGLNAAVLALQSSQLADAAEKSAASVASVVRSLEEIATHVGEMADDSRTLSGISSSEASSYFMQMEEGCGAILFNLKHLADADSATRVASGDLQETIARMLRSIAEIRQIELQMKHMALNASIVATQIGGLGNGMHVLALSMRERAADSGQRSEGLLQLLASLREEVIRLFGHGGPGGSTRQINQDACDGMIAAVAGLHTSGERSVTRIAEIIGCGASLRDDLLAARRSFSAGDLFHDGISRARRTLGEVGDEILSDLLRSANHSLEFNLNDFAGHYTMQSERDVHARFTGTPSPMAPSGGDPQDSVEFF